MDRPSWVLYRKSHSYVPVRRQQHETLGFKMKRHCSPFSFLRREMNFLGGMTPTFFFCVAMLLNRSARQVRRDSFRRGCTFRNTSCLLTFSSFRGKELWTIPNYSYLISRTDVIHTVNVCMISSYTCRSDSQLEFCPSAINYQRSLLSWTVTGII